MKSLELGIMKKVHDICEEHGIEFFICYQDLTSVYSAEWYKTRVQFQFEDTAVWGSQNYDDLLKTDYGEYMVFPPEDQRAPHHTVQAFYKQ